jgi:hypothetical protein
MAVDAGEQRAVPTLPATSQLVFFWQVKVFLKFSTLRGFKYVV